MDERERYQQGMSMRRAVLGDAQVDRARKHRDDLNEAFQDLITRYAWGEIGTRPGLPRGTRSLITVAMMVALNRNDELKMHMRAAFNNGVTREEIKKSCCKRRFTAACPRPIPHSMPRKKCSRKPIQSRTKNARPSRRAQAALRNHIQSLSFTFS